MFCHSTTNFFDQWDELCEQRNSPGTVSEDLCQDAREEFELSVDTLFDLGGDDWCQGVRPRLQKYFFLNISDLIHICWTQWAGLLEPLSLTKSLTSCPLPSLGLIRT